MASLAWVWTLALQQSYLGRCPEPKLYQPLRIWWLLINDSILKNEAAGGGSFSFSSWVLCFPWSPAGHRTGAFLMASAAAMREEQDICIPHMRFCSKFWKTSKSSNGCLQSIQDCKTLLINKTWNCLHHILSLKFRAPLWNMDLQKH